MFYLFIHRWTPSQIFPKNTRMEQFIHIIKGASLAKISGECLYVYGNFEKGLAWQVWDIQEGDLNLLKRQLETEHQLETEIIPVEKIWPNIDRVPISVLLSPEREQYTIDDI